MYKVNKFKIKYEIERRFFIISANSITKIEIKEKDQKYEQINWPTQLTYVNITCGQVWIRFHVHIRFLLITNIHIHKLVRICKSYKMRKIKKWVSTNYCIFLKNVTSLHFSHQKLENYTNIVTICHIAIFLQIQEKIIWERNYIALRSSIIAKSKSLKHEAKSCSIH